MNLRSVEAHNQCHRSKKILAHRDTYNRFIFYCQTHTTGAFREDQQVWLLCQSTKIDGSMTKRVRKSLGEDRWLTHYWYDNLNGLRELSGPFGRDQRLIDMYFEVMAELQHESHMTRNPRVNINFVSCPNQAWCVSLVNTIDRKTFNYQQELTVQLSPSAKFKPLTLMEIAASKVIKSARSYDILLHWAEKIFNFTPRMEFDMVIR